MRNDGAGKLRASRYNRECNNERDSFFRYLKNYIKIPIFTKELKLNITELY